MFELIPCFVSSASVSRFKRAQVAFRAFSIEVSTILGEFVRFTLVFLGLCMVPHRALVLKLAKEAGAKFDLEPDVLAGKFLMERKELGSRRVDKLSLKERVARTVLRFVRAQGHPCVNLRKVKDNKKFIYYCTLCFAPCYGDSALFDHLKGKLHKKMCTAAELTLLKPNPWPFNDGLVFFDNSAEDEKLLESDDKGPRPLESRKTRSLATVEHGDDTQQISPWHDASDAALEDDGENRDILIPSVLIKGQVSDLMVRILGAGKIAARYLEKDDASSSICRIWCEWLGKQSTDGNSVEIPKHDFAIIILVYSYDLGTKGIFEYVIESLSRRHDSSREENAASGVSSLRDKSDDQITHTRIFSSREKNRELRRQRRIAEQRDCSICHLKMLRGKHVATLTNLKTERRACSTRNFNGVMFFFLPLSIRLSLGLIFVFQDLILRCRHFMSITRPALSTGYFSVSLK